MQAATAHAAAVQALRKEVRVLVLLELEAPLPCQLLRALPHRSSMPGHTSSTRPPPPCAPFFQSLANAKGNVAMRAAPADENSA